MELKLRSTQTQETILDPKKTKSVFVKPRKDRHQDMVEIFKIAKSLARNIGMKPVAIVDYYWSEKAQGWGIIVQEV